MFRTTICGTMLTLLLASTLTLAFNVQTAKAAMIVVPDDYLTIQEAVNAAVSGDKIIVKPGTYVGNVKIDKSYLTIESEAGAESTIISAAGSSAYCIEIVADNVEISGFYVQGDGYSKFGISLDNVSNCRIMNSITGLRCWHGIALHSSAYNTLISNICRGDHMIVIDNSSHHNMVIGNTFGGLAFNGGNMGIHLAGWSNIIRNNTLTYLQHAVILQLNSTDNKILNNTISYNACGLEILAGCNNTIEDNTIKSNNDTGISIQPWCANNVIMSNDVISNGRVYSFGGNNWFYLNNFINNTEIANYFKTSDFWDSCETMTYSYNGVTHVNYLGNYWNDYVGSDANGDGTGDAPYIIDDKNTDNYPLMNPWIRDVKPWDVNTDGKVDILDVAIVAKHFMFRPDEPNWEDRCDLDLNGIIDIIDLTIVARHYGEITVTLDFLPSSNLQTINKGCVHIEP